MIKKGNEMKKIIYLCLSVALLLLITSIGFAQSNSHEQAQRDVIETILNGLKITLDANTGSIIKLQREEVEL